MSLEYAPFPKVIRYRLPLPANQAGLEYAPFPKVIRSRRAVGLIGCSLEYAPFPKVIRFDGVDSGTVSWS